MPAVQPRKPVSRTERPSPPPVAVAVAVAVPLVRAAAVVDADADAVRADAGSLPQLVAAHFELAGLRCRVVCVDEVLPQHQSGHGSTRVRQRYLPNEVAHFELAGHRWALVLDQEPPSAAARPGADIHALLTNRELQIVQLICNGLLTKQVGDRLRISEFTVRSYLKTIYCKLGVRSRGAMVYAYAQSFARSQRGGSAAAD